MKIKILLLLCFFSIQSFAQKNIQIDSLEKLMTQQDISDTSRIDILNQLSQKYESIDSLKSLEYANNSLAEAQKHAYDLGISRAYRRLAKFHFYYNNFGEAIQKYKEGISFAKKIKNSQFLLEAYNDIAKAYFRQADFEKSLDYFLKAIPEAEKIKDNAQKAKLFNNIAAVVLKGQEDHQTATKYYLKALNLNKKENNKLQMASNYNNLGIVYKDLKDYKKSFVYYQKALSIYKDLKNEKRIASVWSNLGVLFFMQEKYEKAEKYHKKTIELEQKVNGKVKASSYNTLAKTYLKQNKLKEAEELLKKAKEISENSHNPTTLANVYQNYSILEEKRNNFNEALKYYKEFHKTQQNILDAKSNKQINQMKVLFETEQKENENELLRQEAKINQSTIQWQFYLNIGIGFILSSAILFTIVLYKNNKQKQRLNQELQLQKAEIQTQNEELQQQQEEIITQRDYIEEQNEELKNSNFKIESKSKVIDSSIRVARQIQKAILPYPDRMLTTLGEHFVLNKPKDIVSGDFYWLHQGKDRTLLAVADCTGHGVPGALMSMIGHSILDKIIAINQIIEPAKILEELDKEIKLALRNPHSKSQGGMDIGIVTWRNITQDNIKLKFAAAKRPLYYILPNTTKVIELKGTRRSIGNDLRKSTHFQQIVEELPQGTQIYMSSDGFSDQNNEQRKRLGTDIFKNILLTNHNLTFEEQKEELENILENYMKNTTQRDDILVLGFKI